MQIDTGATVSIISEATYKQLWSHENSPPIEATNMKLSTYSGDMLETVGTVTCTIEYQGQKYQLPLVIVEQEGPTPLGSNWLSQIRLTWPELTKQILSVHEKVLNPILDCFFEVFRDELGTYNGPKVKLVVDPLIPQNFTNQDPYHMQCMTKLHNNCNTYRQQELLNLSSHRNGPHLWFQF